jgi:Spy/CpxP family protein refolding chaperone
MYVIRTIVLSIVTLLLLSPAAAADKAAQVTDADAIRTAVKTDKRQYVASLLSLTDAEAKSFWPVYEDYQRSLNRYTSARGVAMDELLSRSTPMTDRYAAQIARQLAKADAAAGEGRQKMEARVVKTLPGVKAVRYIQLENKIRAVQEYDLAMVMPLLP